MKNGSESTPLWLDIKTEYIDENLDRVIDYLHICSIDSANEDSFYHETIRLFGKRIDLLELPHYRDQIHDILQQSLIADIEYSFVPGVHLNGYFAR